MPSSTQPSTLRVTVISVSAYGSVMLRMTIGECVAYGSLYLRTRLSSMLFGLRVGGTCGANLLSLIDDPSELSQWTMAP